MIPVTLLQAMPLLALSSPALCWSPVSAPTPRLRGAASAAPGLGLHGNGSISVPAAPTGAAWKVPTAAVGACPPAKPAALPAPMQRQPRYFWLHLETCTFSSGNDAKRDGIREECVPLPFPIPGGCRRTWQSGQRCGGAVCLGGKRCSSSCSRAMSSARLLRGCDVAVGPRNPGLPWQRQPQVSAAAPGGTKG